MRRPSIETVVALAAERWAACACLGCGSIPAPLTRASLAKPHLCHACLVTLEPGVARLVARYVLTPLRRHFEVVDQLRSTPKPPTNKRDKNA